MIVCKRCGKENQDHYKFCLGCGAELAGGPGGADAGGVGMMKTVMADASSAQMPRQNLPGVAAAPGGPAPGGPGGPAPGGPGGPGGPAPGQPMPGPGQPGPGGPGASAPGMGVAPGPGGPGMGAPPSGPMGQPPTPNPGAAGGIGNPAAGPGMAPGPQGPGPQTPGAPGPGPAPMPAAPGGAPAPNGGSAPGAGPGAAAALRKCPQCSSDIPPNFRFCGVCGFNLADASAGAAAPAAQEQSAPAAAAPQPAAAAARLTLIRPDGSEGGTHDLQVGENRLGRSHGGIFENDGYLSPEHALLTVSPPNAVVRDLDSLNGVFYRMTEEEEIVPGQIIRIGQELLRFDVIEAPAPLEDGTEVMGSPNPGYWGKLTVIIGNGVDGSAYPLLGDSATLGRERGDINFPDDGYVSGLHARLSQRDGKVYLADMGSSNGTFLRIREERQLGADSYILLGQQLFKLTMN